MSIQKLVTALQGVVSDPSVVAKPYLTDGCEGDLPQSVQDAVELACGELIASGGRPNYPAMRELATAGFPVGPGEVDSFGWLTGMISTPKGAIVYG
jgi:hypothetical protein